MFKNKQREYSPPCTSPLVAEVQETVKDENGRVHSTIVRKPLTRDHFPHLPKPDTFSIEAYQNAGIPLKQVNTKVLEPSDSIVENYVNSVIDSMENQYNQTTD